MNVADDLRALIDVCGFGNLRMNSAKWPNHIFAANSSTAIDCLGCSGEFCLSPCRESNQGLTWPETCAAVAGCAKLTAMSRRGYLTLTLAAFALAATSCA